MGLLASNKGKPMQGIVEQVRDGSTIRVYLLPEFQFVQVFVAGVQVDIADSDWSINFFHYFCAGFYSRLRFSNLYPFFHVELSPLR